MHHPLAIHEATLRGQGQYRTSEHHAGPNVPAPLGSLRTLCGLGRGGIVEDWRLWVDEEAVRKPVREALVERDVLTFQPALVVVAASLAEMVEGVDCKPPKAGAHGDVRDPLVWGHREHGQVKLRAGEELRAGRQVSIPRRRVKIGADRSSKGGQRRGVGDS